VIEVIHIVICDNKEKELDKIINKERTMLIRGNVSRRIPHSRIYINDELYFVNKGENISFYHATVTNADSLSKLTKDEIDNIFETNKDKLNLTEKETSKWKKKCLCLINFDSLEKIEGLNIPSYTPLEDWIMVNSLDELINR
jgi:hypothetical protein